LGFSRISRVEAGALFFGKSLCGGFSDWNGGGKGKRAEFLTGIVSASARVNANAVRKRAQFKRETY